MQAHVQEILTAATAVTGITKATARAFRESDDYPLFYCGGRSLPDGKNEATDGAARHYNQDWEYINHIYVEANTENNSDTVYSDYTQAEGLVDAFLAQLLVLPEWKLESLDFYPARLGDVSVIVAEIIVSKFRTKRYG